MPQSSINGQPKRASTSSIFATGILCPPTVQRVSEERSVSSSFGSSSRYMYIVGTPSSIVARYFSMLARISSALKTA